MKILISPAKSLNESQSFPDVSLTEPSFIDKAQRIHKVLKKHSPEQLATLMDISPKLAELNWQRNQAWTTEAHQHGRPALFTFDGDVYDGLDAYSLDASLYDRTQSDLRILSGLYGWLRPFDQILPYRLEMGSSLSVGRAAHLYAFWQPILTKQLQVECASDEPIIQLASQEYAHAIDWKKIKQPVIIPEFRDLKNGQLKIISFFAKKARGLMTRYILDHGIDQPEAIKGFTVDGYAYQASLSTAQKWVFTR